MNYEKLDGFAASLHDSHVKHLGYNDFSSFIIKMPRTYFDGTTKPPETTEKLEVSADEPYYWARRLTESNGYSDTVKYEKLDAFAAKMHGAEVKRLGHNFSSSIVKVPKTYFDTTTNAP